MAAATYILRGAADALTVTLVVLACWTGGARADPDDNCLRCHSDALLSTADPHRSLGLPCQSCHGGDVTGSDKDAAHAGLVTSPGTPEDAKARCGACHQTELAGMESSLMYTGRGIVNVTRYVLGEQASPNGLAGFGDLGHTPADSLLRKLCGGCHLGSDRAARQAGAPGMERRGGCLGCHLTRQANQRHPALSVRIGDGQCVGCHSRSARISLSYAGLAEVDPAPGDKTANGHGVSATPENVSRCRHDRFPHPGPLPVGEGDRERPTRDFHRKVDYLSDGRAVVHQADDLHHRAGMACIDCHTGVGLMSSPGRLAQHEADDVDIACADCHANTRPRLRLDQWPTRYAPVKRHIPFAAAPGQEFLVTARHGTPLWNIEVRPDGYLLHRKITGRVIPIPQYEASSHPSRLAHARLTCSACHAQWAPQCYGCHEQYDPTGRQWDQVAGRATPGRWDEQRWEVQAGPPPLGVTGDNRIAPAVPGMILTLEHPNWDKPLFRRLFSIFDPHTTGRSRACGDCHRSSRTLGLGEGRLVRDGEAWTFQACRPRLADGLPADAWTSLDGSRTGGATRVGNRPLRSAEMRRILDALPAPSVGVGGDPLTSVKADCRASP
jgi:hypothetical protein